MNRSVKTAGAVQTVPRQARNGDPETEEEPATAGVEDPGEPARRAGRGRPARSDCVNDHRFMRGETPDGGMTAITPEMGPVPDCWCEYLEVEDCDAVVARALELGGTVAVPAVDVEDVGRFAFLADPAGAHFGVMQPVKAS